METKTVSTRMQSLIALYDIHTDLFSKVIVDISDKDSHSRLDTKANHIAWITGSLVQGRYEMAKETHPELKQSADELFKDHQGIKDGVTYPSLSEFKKDWEKISPISREVLVNMTDEKLDTTFDMGDMKMTYYELVTFMTHREAYLIGQIALWRRLLGYEAMKYQ